MTALERAKAFVQSRAAKTALKILPLALATVVGVSTKAHATTQPTFSGSNTIWNKPACSGGSVACLKPVTLASSNPVPYMTYGSQANGTASGTYNFVTSPGGPVDLQFLMSGNGTGTLSNPIAIQYSFDMTCTGCASTDTFGYEVAGQVYNTASQQFSIDTGVVPTAGPPNESGTIYISPVSGTLDNWQTTIDFLWFGQNGETASFDVSNLAIYPTSGTSSVPEPSSLLLAFTGLPFVMRALRKKR